MPRRPHTDSQRRPRLVASDLDGTLLRSDGTLSRRTIDAVGAAEDAGIAVVLATGRPPRWIRTISDELNHSGVAVCANGALVYDLHLDEVRTAHTLTPDTGAELVERLRHAFPGALFAVETIGHLGLEPAWRTAWPPPAGTIIADALELVRTPMVKLLARIDGHDVEAALDEHGAALADLAELTWSGGSHLLEMSAAGVTKGRTLAELAADLGLAAADAVAFGDMPNDLDMLRWAGRGLAVANAHPRVREAADGVIGANDEDGVAAEIETFLG